MTDDPRMAEYNRVDNQQLRQAAYNEQLAQGQQAIQNVAGIAQRNMLNQMANELSHSFPVGHRMSVRACSTFTRSQAVSERQKLINGKRVASRTYRSSENRHKSNCTAVGRVSSSYFHGSPWSSVVRFVVIEFETMYSDEYTLAELFTEDYINDPRSRSCSWGSRSARSRPIGSPARTTRSVGTCTHSTCTSAWCVPTTCHLMG